jgi:hypothetical protein
VAGTLALLVFYLIFFQVSHNRKFSLFSVAAISFIPMFGYQSSGTTHDILLVLLSSLSILYWVKFLTTRKIKYSIIMAFFLSLSAVTKSTALLLFVPMVGLCFFYIDEKVFYKRFIKILLIASIAMLLPGIWMLRSYMQYGIFLSTWSSVMGDFTEAEILKTSLYQYLTTTHIIDSLYTSFFGEFGWAGQGGLCRVLLLKNSLHFMPLYQCVGGLFAFLSFIFYIKNNMTMHGWKIPYNIFFAVLLFLFFLFFGIPVKHDSLFQMIFYAALLSMFVFSFQTIPLIIIECRKFILISNEYLLSNKEVLIRNKFIYFSLFVCFFYTFIFIVKLNTFYEIFHVLRANHGRYWFPIISLLVIGFVLPAFKLVNIHKYVLLTILLSMVFNEFFIYYYYVVPFLSS